MGLDIVVVKMIKIPDNILTEDACQTWCNEHDYNYDYLDDNHSEYPIEFTKEFDCTVFDYEKAFELLGKNFDDYTWYSVDDTYINFIPKNAEDKPENLLAFEFKNIPTKIEKRRMFVTSNTELGYMRKGANRKFYDDGKWSDNTIVSKKEMLLNDWKKYFSSNKEIKNSFKQNIIDHFIEGQTIVWYC